MDGEQLLKALSPVTKLVVLFLMSGANQAAEESLDPEFLEWLGQAAEVEELGVDIGGLLLARENLKPKDQSGTELNQDDSTEDNSK